MKNNNLAVFLVALAVVGLSLSDALTGHGIKGNKNLNPIVMGDDSGTGTGTGNGSSGSGSGGTGTGTGNGGCENGLTNCYACCNKCCVGEDGICTLCEAGSEEEGTLKCEQNNCCVLSEPYKKDGKNYFKKRTVHHTCIAGTVARCITGESYFELDEEDQLIGTFVSTNATAKQDCPKQ